MGSSPPGPSDSVSVGWVDWFGSLAVTITVTVLTALPVETDPAAFVVVKGVV